MSHSAYTARRAVARLQVRLALKYRPLAAIKVPMVTAKALNLLSYAVQLIALWLATRVDTSALALRKAEEDLPVDYLTEIYLSARDDKPRTPSDAENKLLELGKANDENRNGALLRWAAALVGISILLQAAATWISPG